MTPCSSVGTPRTVPGPLHSSVGMLGSFTLPQDLSFKSWGTSHCPRFLRHGVGTLRTVPIAFVGTPRTVPRLHTQVLGQFASPKTRPKDGTLRTVPGLNVIVLRFFALPQELVLGHLVLSQDFTVKCWDASHCPKTSLF